MKKILIITMIAGVFACNQKRTEQEIAALGELQHDFPISESAKPAFDKGLLLLHSFEYDDAREAFKEAKSADPDEVMAYWGEAMSHYKALWGLQDLEAGREVINQLGDSPQVRQARAENELEKEFWQGVEILYGEGERGDRQKKYARHMENLYEKYPGNQEVAAFYSLGLMWSNEEGADEDIYVKSAKVAEGILEENPNHPGALHYMIHAYDDPDYAKLAKQAADKYASVAPDATHALHMPSHIYVALGMWNNVVASNEASYGASVNRMERKELTEASRGYHSYAWLHYGYLQQGRYNKALELLQDMQQFNKLVNNRTTRSYLISMQAEQLVETKSFTDFKPDYVEYNDLGLIAKAEQNFTKAYFAFKNEDKNSIEKAIKELGTHLTTAELNVTEGGVALCSAGPSRYAPNKKDILRTKAVMHQMEAFVSLLEQKKESAEEHMKKAVALELESGSPIGPPDIPYLTFEFYADWLVEEGRTEEALDQYQASLNYAPKRALALQGKRDALIALGRDEEAKEVQAELDVFWKPEVLASVE